MEAATSEITYGVPGMTCEHCRAAITDEVSKLAGVNAVDVDLGSKRVRVRGIALDRTRIEAAIQEAGYEAQAV